MRTAARPLLLPVTDPGQISSWVPVVAQPPSPRQRKATSTPRRAPSPSPPVLPSPSRVGLPPRSSLPTHARPHEPPVRRLPAAPIAGSVSALLSLALVSTTALDDNLQHILAAEVGFDAYSEQGDFEGKFDGEYYHDRDYGDDDAGDGFESQQGLDNSSPGAQSLEMSVPGGSKQLPLSPVRFAAHADGGIGSRRV